MRIGSYLLTKNQVASSALGFGPHLAMQLAERLYTQGFIRYFFHLFKYHVSHLLIFFTLFTYKLHY